MAVDYEDSFKCKSCSELFNGCSECDSDSCKKCEKDEWVLTDNGCAYEEPYQPLEPEFSSSSMPHGQSLLPIVNPSSKPEDTGNTNTGMIVGIVVGVVVIAIIVAVVIYFVATRGKKHGKIDPKIFEKDVEFETMSIL